MAKTVPEQPARPATRETLMLWVIHRFAEDLRDHAILKGGMALRLLDSPRLTNDVDWVLVPYNSKKAVIPLVDKILDDLIGADVIREVHSKMARYEIRLDGVAIQLEIAVSKSCPSVPMATAALALAQGKPSRVVRIMKPSVAFAHKIAAWNERRLLRDLYDAHFLATRADIQPDRAVIEERLENVQSRLPSLRHRRSMTMKQLCKELRAELGALTPKAIDEELGGLLESAELAGLHLRMRTSLSQVVDHLDD